MVFRIHINMHMTGFITAIEHTTRVKVEVNLLAYRIYKYYGGNYEIKSVTYSSCTRITHNITFFLYTV